MERDPWVCDYWRASIDGKLYTICGYLEDGTSQLEPGRSAPLEKVPAGARLSPTLGPRFSYATHFGQCRRRVGDRVRHQALRPPLLAARRADLLLAPLGSTAVVVHRHLRQPLARLTQQPRQHPHAVVQQAAVGRLQDIRLGTVLSIRTCVPDSIPRCLASCNSTPLRRSASIAPTALCNADFEGTWNTSKSPVSFQARATAAGGARHAGADHVEQFGVLIFQDRMDNLGRLGLRVDVSVVVVVYQQTMITETPSCRTSIHAHSTSCERLRTGTTLTMTPLRRGLVGHALTNRWNVTPGSATIGELRLPNRYRDNIDRDTASIVAGSLLYELSETT